MQTAIIGCGVIAATHAKALALDGRATLAWAIDLDLVKAKALGAVRIGADWRAAIDDPSVELVIVCTPHHLHVDIALAAMAAGKHVLCEKPLATTPADVARLVAAERSGRRMASGVFQHRYSPLARRLRDLVRGGDLGAVTAVRVDFRCTRDRGYYASGPWRGRWDGEGGGLLINQAIHTIDMAQWIAGAPIAVEEAVVERRRLGDAIEVEDHATARVRLQGGAAMELRCDNDLETDWFTSIAVDCADGGFTLGTGDSLASFTHPSATLAAELRAFDRIRDDVVKLPGKDAYGDRHALQIADCVSAARAGRPAMVTIAEASVAIGLVLGIYHAAATGLPARLPLTTFRRPLITPSNVPASPIRKSA